MVGLVRVEGQLDVVRGCGLIVDIQIEEDGGELFHSTPARMTRREDVAVWKDA
jgi:hypothetical protein